jgi:hypothetical protein
MTTTLQKAAAFFDDLSEHILRALATAYAVSPDIDPDDIDDLLREARAWNERAKRQCLEEVRRASLGQPD